MLHTVLAASSLLVLASGSPEAPPLPQGRYAAPAAGGIARCAEPDAPGLAIRLAPDLVPPHPRSANLGEIVLTGGDGEPRHFVITGASPREAPEGPRLVLDGGRQFTAGREIDGITDAQLAGRFTAVLAIGDDGRLRLEDARWWNSSRPARGEEDGQPIAPDLQGEAAPWLAACL